MAPRYTVNHIDGTFAHQWHMVRRNIDVVCQELISFISQAEVQKLAAIKGVGFASFGGVVIDPPNGDILADGWLTEIKIVGFTHKEHYNKWTGVHSADMMVTVAYKGITVLTQEDVGEATRPPADPTALAGLRQQFQRDYGV